MKFLILIPLFMCTIIGASETVYRWQDDKGRWHFSDRPVEGKPSTAIKSEEIASINWKPSPSIEVEKAMPATPGNQTFSKKRKRCESLAERVERYEKKSKLYLDNPKYKEKKREYRWKMQKEC